MVNINIDNVKQRYQNVAEELVTRRDRANLELLIKRFNLFSDEFDKLNKNLSTQIEKTDYLALLSNLEERDEIENKLKLYSNSLMELINELERHCNMGPNFG